MSAMGVKLGPRRAQPQCLLYPPITDINDRRINVGFVPAGDMEGGTPSHYSGMPAFLKPANIPLLYASQFRLFASCCQ
jgi:hypothetical protein